MKTELAIEILKEVKGSTPWTSAEKALNAAIAALENEKPTNLEQIMNEYDSAKDDKGWESPHPIFLMAAEIDSLRFKNRGMIEAVESIESDLLERVTICTETESDILKSETYACNVINILLTELKRIAGGE